MSEDIRSPVKIWKRFSSEARLPPNAPGKSLPLSLAAQEQVKSGVQLRGIALAAVWDLEFTRLPEQLVVDAPVRQAFCLVRLAGRPVGRVILDLERGSITGAELRSKILAEMDWPFWERWLQGLLEWDPVPDMAEFPSATVAICTRDRPEDLQSCLAAVTALPDLGQEVLVIDSCSSTPATCQVVGAFPGVRYVREEAPGLDRARNRACLEARTEILAFVDDDAVPDPGWLQALLRNFQDRRVMCVTGLTMPLELETPAQQWFETYSSFNRGFGRRVFSKDNLNPLQAGRAGAGVNMAIRREALESLGLFDETLDAGTPTCSGGDTEMFARLLAAGYHIVYDTAALSWHRHRRDWPSLRKTLQGYGSGVYAFWTHSLLRKGEWGVIGQALNWILRYQLPALFRSALRFKPSTPIDLLLFELAGCIAGPINYLKSQRQSAKRRDNGVLPYEPLPKSQPDYPYA